VSEEDTPLVEWPPQESTGPGVVVEPAVRGDATYLLPPSLDIAMDERAR
jgi:hypothetical protein